MNLRLWFRRLLEPGAPRREVYPPVVIGATGGSGTRAIQAVLERAGVFMGARVNHAGDAMDFEPFLDRYINLILQETRSLNYTLDALPDGLRAEVVEGFKAALETYMAEVPSGRLWGWKNPRSMYILPIIEDAFPDFRFVHLLRDGRYMAQSRNQNQVRKHYGSLFGRSSEDHLAVTSARLWAVTNTQVANWGRDSLGARYIWLRHESLCAEPLSVVNRLFERLGLSGEATMDLVTDIAARPPRGPEESLDRDVEAEIAAVTRQARETFGYEVRRSEGV